MENEKKIIYEMILKKYGSVTLSRKQAAEILGVSMSTLDRMKNRREGPRPIKLDGGMNSLVRYPIQEIVEYLASISHPEVPYAYR